MSKVSRILAIVLLAIAATGFGLTSLCGGILIAQEAGEGGLLRNFQFPRTALTLGAWLIGGALCALCVWGIVRLLRRRP